MKRLFKNSILCALVLLVWAGAGYADVYKYRDTRGMIHLTDAPMGRGYVLLKRFSLPGTRQRGSNSGNALAEMHRRRSRYSTLIDDVARQTRVRAALLHAVVRAESAYRADAESRKGALGLMQLMPDTAARFGVTDRLDPHQNLLGGATYLGVLLDQFEHDLKLALAGYNAGENAVVGYGNQIPPYPETQAYVRKVLAFYDENLAAERLAQR